MAVRASLRDTSGYGSGLRKFHLFCDIFSVPENIRLPAPFAVLHSFALWAATDPTQDDPYLAAVRAWHIAQGWPPPLSLDDHQRINWSLRGLENIYTSRRKPIRPPVTLIMLSTLKGCLQLNDPFDACVWAMASCAFFGMMHFGEISVNSRSDFSPARHITRHGAFFGTDLLGQSYARLDLPSAKTAKPGETQSVFLTEQGDLCPLAALRNLARVVPALATDPLFCWRDSRGDTRPMVRKRAVERVNGILLAHGWGTTFGHSFRIGGASFYLAQKVDPEIVRLAGRWRSLAYETYIRSFEQVASRHLAGLASQLHSSAALGLGTLATSSAAESPACG
ncbi:hypothetical protein DEU56DRAFT_731723 [Suillus clintonianus]|uniref:uncharacterized protein n=1 Tax=Suillus clintonianus TaxID=1904413 RepID=UPI001B865D1F|nr:uncharacterized protein DEU56DRAFT_731723 [Suillus clintonianus]KAG2146275.1 hypothetical protein DEU56DRAFT_731723 [Suillus clintonianus]